MQGIFEAFIRKYTADIVQNDDGSLCREMYSQVSSTADRIIDDIRVSGIADISGEERSHDRLSKWLLTASPEQKRQSRLDLEIPPEHVHFVPGQYRVFYDFKNTDIVLDELHAAGIPIKGSLLDFGCSSGRNLATLQRAYPDELELTGADPAQVSIDWLNANVPGVTAIVSQQDPPLPFGDERFDLIIAKSIWTHFSPSAGRRWFAEMRRILKRGGHFAFSTHGPHDVASRILLNIPSPRYERYTGHKHWTRETFLADLIETYEQNGHYFQAFKQTGYQPDLNLVKDAETADWGLLFVSPEYLREMLPPDMTIVRRSVGRTGNRHDLYLVRRD